MQVPFVKCDATKFSAVGYVGADIEDTVRGLVTAADGDVSAAECGIVYVDEVDKLACACGGSQTTMSGGFGASSPGTVNTKDVQTSLLKVLEVGELHLPAEKRIPTRFGQVSVSRITRALSLRICGSHPEGTHPTTLSPSPSPSPSSPSPFTGFAGPQVIQRRVQL